MLQLWNGRAKIECSGFTPVIPGRNKIGGSLVGSEGVFPAVLTGSYTSSLTFTPSEVKISRVTEGFFAANLLPRSGVCANQRGISW